MHDSLHLGIIADSGAPQGSADYTTIVLFHGFGWTSDAVRKMLPIAKANNARIFLANRRDYPETIPYSLEERSKLFAVAVADPDEAQKILLPWMKERGREVNAGGIVVGGWSFGTTLMTALLANANSFPRRDIDLRKYLRRVIFLDPPDLALGIPQEPHTWTVNSGTRISPEKALREMSILFSAYFKHGDVDKPETYEHKPLDDPRPTWYNFTPQEVDLIYHAVPGDSRGGSDATLMAAGIPSQVFKVLREQSLLAGEGSGWEAVEVRQIWGDHSIAPMIWGAREMKAEVDKQQYAGVTLRKVSFVRVSGANHVMVWDFPEETLAAILQT